MIIDRDISRYIIFAEDNVLNALRKISDNKSRIIFSVSERGYLEGVLTDGDFRRWLVTQDNINLNIPVSKISNKNYTSARINDDSNKIQSCFSEQIDFIPLLDERGHLVAVARQKPEGVRIGPFEINDLSQTFIIAEIGNNHNGSLDLAKHLIDLAASAGANCAKFQMRHMSALYRNQGDAADRSEDLGSQYTLDLLSRFQLTPDEMFEAFDHCKDSGILPLCTPWDLESLSLLEDYGMLAYKVASADLTNHDLLQAIAKTGKTMLCSTGMSTEQEIRETAHLLRQIGAMFVLLHCNSTYPAPFKDVNLNYLARLKKIGECPVGYSGHERGINVAIAAVAMGARVIEKHFTIDKTMEGNDHKVSLLPEEMKTMVDAIRQVEESLGSEGERRPSQGELMNRETLAKSLIINCDLNVGEVITAGMIDTKSPGQGLQPNRKHELIGTIAKRPFKKGDFFFASDVDYTRVEPRSYSFCRPWGIPVRYHDFRKLMAKTNPDLLEFHLSYRDLEEDISNYFTEPLNLGLVVHSPELFKGDHVLDLASPDEDYRRQSIENLQKVVELTRKLSSYFSRTERTYVVTNIGGFTLDDFVPVEKREELYGLVMDSLSQIDCTQVEIIPQTMPPFPWHFGGQRYHNLFVDPGDIVRFCSKYGYRICLDISHSKLACNYFNWSFLDFIRKVRPYIAHLHIVDASGIDGEGLQIGEGEIDFAVLAEELNKGAKDASFIPEIWQGHKNEGEGFWISLDRLENFFQITS